MTTTKRPYMPKNEYDQLYYYIPANVYNNKVINGRESPLMFASPRRYDNLDAARKAALAKSKKIMSERRAIGFSMHSPDICVMKGTRFVGSVCVETGGIADGIWQPAGSRDLSPLRNDGTIGTKRK